MLQLPPSLWTLAALTLVYVLLAAAMSWLLGWPNLSGVPLAPLGIALIVLAFILPVWAVVLFRREGTETNPTSPTNRLLITDGPYRFTRNPIWAVVASFGIAIQVGAWPKFAAPIVVFATANWVHIPFEDAKMRRQFGAAYDDYLVRVRR